jgi:hypothetical protein
VNLSFVPGDLHLTQSDDGLFILTIAGKKILSTKSEPYALHKFNTLRTELEHRFPARELTAETKAELLRNEVAASVFREERPVLPTAQVATPTLFEIETALRSYCETVLKSDLSDHSKADYINGADNFVRWLKGDFDPGSRVARPRRREKTEQDLA